MGHPADDYRPFGLVASPWSFARSWEESYGGTLRSTEQRPGFGWVEPWAFYPLRGLGLEVGLTQDGRTYRTRGDFAAVGLTCAYHSANLFEYGWQHGDVACRARFYAGGDGLLVLCWRLVNRSQRRVSTTPEVVGWLWQRHEQAFAPGYGLDAEEAGLEITWPIWFDEGLEVDRATGEEVRAERLMSQPGLARRASFQVPLVLEPGGEAGFSVLMARDDQTVERASEALANWQEREADLLADDDGFWERCPRLSGDWPPEFRRGLVYDFETTRMLLQPPGGIFTDLWPAWMVNWPRVVLAEGTLDMLRLSFAAPELAQRAVLSMFRDAAAANVPCVFRHGEPNMVAQDGSVCGTSPAWCVPFHNLRLLYLRTLDRDWLRQLYPYLAAYVRWWLDNRSDDAGWVVYRCTWEAGEDNSTRLDPDGAGDHVISQYARPIELQAAIADAANCLAFFAGELGVAAEEWGPVEHDALARVARLWDAQEGRFRDWDVRRSAFIEPSGRSDYWGTDPRRFSALSLTPLLFGQTSRDQAEALRREIEQYQQPPFCEWPSWSYIVLEAASQAGWYDFAGRVAHGICRRVYAENDRRDLAPFERPIPGVAREYWPMDLSTFRASEGYGWGATTASLVIRQLCGFYEAPGTSGFAFRLAPGFPRELIGRGELGIGPLQYRGRQIWLRYRRAGAGEMEVEIELDGATALVARDERTAQILLNGQRARRHRFRLAMGGVVAVQGEPPGDGFENRSQ